MTEHAAPVPSSDVVPSRPVPELVGSVLSEPGQPLETATREGFSARLGFDFSDVRVHADDRAARSARELDASAYTSGSHVVFGTGRYAPATPAGRRLLTHELTHVGQQHGAGPAALGALAVAPEHGPDERAATGAAAKAPPAGTAPLAVGPSLIQRAPEGATDAFDDAQLNIAPDQFTPFVGTSLDKVLAPGVVTVVVFTAPKCEPCHKLMQILSDQAAGRAKIGVKIQYFSVDNSVPGNKEISAQYNAVTPAAKIYIFVGSSVRYQGDQQLAPDEYPKIFTPILSEAAATHDMPDTGHGGMSTGATVALHAGGGLVAGALIGALAGGPIGALVGAGIGGAVGALAGLWDPFGLSGRTKPVGRAEAGALITARLGSNIKPAIAGCTLAGTAAGYPKCNINVLPGPAFIADYAAKHPGETREDLAGWVEDTTPKTIWINQDLAEPGILVHEGIHTSGADAFRGMDISGGNQIITGFNLNEGVTEFLTRQITSEQRIDRAGIYDNEYAAVAALVAATGCEPELLRAYFEGGAAVDALRDKVDKRLGAGRYTAWTEAVARRHWDAANALLAH